MRIRTVFQPLEEIEVTDADAEVLRLQGLIHVPAEPAGEPAPAPVPVPAAAQPDPPAADSAPTDQAPTTQKG